MKCKNCIHYKICCNEGRDDEALTFCADFFEVVRCKDCKHFVETSGMRGGCFLFQGMTNPRNDDFCSEGERKETE